MKKTNEPKNEIQIGGEVIFKPNIGIQKKRFTSNLISDPKSTIYNFNGSDISTDKEIHFYTGKECMENINLDNFYESYNETVNAINNGMMCIRTYQMCLLSKKLYSKGYKIFVHESPFHKREIKKEETDDTYLFLQWERGKFKGE